MIKNRVVRNEATHGGSLALRQENEGLRKLIADQVRALWFTCVPSARHHTGNLEAQHYLTERQKIDRLTNLELGLY